MTEQAVTLPDCAVCGASEFARFDVLWPELIAAWRLSRDEAAYINRQQGLQCVKCGCNLRSIVLARALAEVLSLPVPLAPAILERPPSARVLEINEAGHLSGVLRHLPDHVLATYPEVDIHSLPFEAGAFDIVIHSDTLEHVERPLRALEECRRVLRPGGACVFTVPVVVGRMSISCEGRAASYHGAQGTAADDLRVATEFGADVWTYPIRAGFARLGVHALEFPSATAWVAYR